MKAEIISIGSEITSGQNLDTNCQWLSRRLAEIGIPVHWHTTIADDLEDNIAAFRIASQRAGLVLSTGGLGPTQDDLTREVLARVAGVELVLNQQFLQHIQKMFAERRRIMPDRNQVQAFFPAGSDPIPNAKGTAPGIWIRLGECVVAAMPGVPSEMFAMFETQVQPRLLALGLGGGVLIQRKINCFGAGESAIEKMVFDLTQRGHVPEVGITVSDATVSLRILARAESIEKANAQISPIEQTIRDRLGNLVFGVDDEELQHIVLKVLGEQRKTLATAEDVTTGLLAQRLGNVKEASPWFRGGLIATDNRIKCDMLMVPQIFLDNEGTVSARVAQAMAASCRTRFCTDLAVSTVGIAGPEGAMPDKPVGLVFVGLAWEGGTGVQNFSWTGSPDEIRSRAAKLALNSLRIHLLQSTM